MKKLLEDLETLEVIDQYDIWALGAFIEDKGYVSASELTTILDEYRERQ